MGKDDKEDSGFGFKDKAKAEETLKLLEEHPMNYRRLTVRGLLGRAKRVLSMTKAEEKIKNIKEAMEVFENWIQELDKNKEQKTEQKEKVDKKKETEEKNGDAEDSSSDDVEMEEEKPAKKELPSDKVPGLGFKDKEAADGTLKALEGRDPEYQKLAVKGLIGSAKRVLTCTRDETKLSNIKEAMGVLEKFLDDYDSNHMSKQNNYYIGLGHVRTADKMADAVTEQQKSFIAAYSSVNGEYKRLRTVPEKEGGKTWDIVRNEALKQLKEKHAEAKLFNDKEQPTKEHIEMMLWAYSPEPARVKKYVPETKEEKRDSDSKSVRKDEKKTDSDSKSGGKEEKKSDSDSKSGAKEEKQDRKRRSSGRDRDDDSTSKKKRD